MSEIDLYAVENEPIAIEVWTTYLLRLPRPAEFPTKEQPYVYVEVDNYGMLNVSRRSIWLGGLLGERHSTSNNALYMEIYEWLVEWEFAEWKSIGPEDRELFATEKLIGKGNSNE